MELAFFQLCWCSVAEKIRSGYGITWLFVQWILFSLPHRELEFREGVRIVRTGGGIVLCPGLFRDEGKWSCSILSRMMDGMVVEVFFS